MQVVDVFLISFNIIIIHFVTKKNTTWNSFCDFSASTKNKKIYYNNKIHSYE